MQIVRDATVPSRLSTVAAWIGVELDEVSVREKLVSAVGGAVAILGVLLISKHALGLEGAAMLIASMGASAVLLFAVPHGQLSQPWPTLAGHTCAAIVGVACAKTIGNVELAAACAVAITIGLMHQFRFIHPPGGATALTAVIGGPAVRALGWGYVWHPVLLNALTISVVAFLFNWPFPWRRWPARFVRRARATTARPELTHASILAAMRSLDSFLDITEDDVARLYERLAGAPPSP